MFINIQLMNGFLSCIVYKANINRHKLEILQSIPHSCEMCFVTYGFFFVLRTC